MRLQGLPRCARSSFAPVTGSTAGCDTVMSGGGSSNRSTAASTANAADGAGHNAARGRSTSKSGVTSPGIRACRSGPAAAVASPIPPRRVSRTRWVSGRPAKARMHTSGAAVATAAITSRSSLTIGSVMSRGPGRNRRKTEPSAWMNRQARGLPLTEPSRFSTLDGIAGIAARDRSRRSRYRNPEPRRYSITIRRRSPPGPRTMTRSWIPRPPGRPTSRQRSPRLQRRRSA